jgi:N-acetylmuramoyl-L-alanine amidase
MLDYVDNGYEVIVGRPLTIMVAHAKGFNERGIGICFIGNYEKSTPSDQMINVAVDRIITPLCLLYNIHPDRVVAHRDVGTTATVCPGRNFPMQGLRHKIEWR